MSESLHGYLEFHLQGFTFEVSTLTFILFRQCNIFRGWELGQTLVYDMMISMCKMNKKAILILLMICFGCYSSFSQINKDLTIAFGSCNKQDQNQPLWDDIGNEKPNLWIWLGDNIYGDSDDPFVLRAKYNMQLNNPGYKKFIEKVPVIGTWDDHDYGKNDGNKTFNIKKESQALALDFFNEPAESSRRKQQGIYTSYSYNVGKKKIKVILLDVRYHQDPLKKDENGYIPDPQADILGEEQWRWLEKQLRGSRANVNIIGSGLQFIPEEHRTEKWGNFPSSLSRFYKLLSKSKVKGVILITGDRHIGEISKTDIPGVKYPIYEFTSSGLTHSTTNSKSINKYRIGSLVTQKHYGVFRFTSVGKHLNLEASLKGEDGVTYTTEKIQFRD